jgi:hypothetical protein
VLLAILDLGSALQLLGPEASTAKEALAAQPAPHRAAELAVEALEALIGCEGTQVGGGRPGLGGGGEG